MFEKNNQLSNQLIEREEEYEKDRRKFAEEKMANQDLIKTLNNSISILA